MNSSCGFLPGLPAACRTWYSALAASASADAGQWPARLGPQAVLAVEVNDLAVTESPGAEVEQVPGPFRPGREPRDHARVVLLPPFPAFGLSHHATGPSAPSRKIMPRKARRRRGHRCAWHRPAVARSALAGAMRMSLW